MTNEVRADGGCLYCEADQGESHRPNCTRAALSPAPAGGEAMNRADADRQITLDLMKTITVMRSEGRLEAVATLERVLDHIGFLNMQAAFSAPPPSPDVAGVVDKLTQRAIEAKNQDDFNFFRDVTTLLTTLFAERERLVEATRLRPMSEAKKDRTPVLLQVKDTLPRDDLKRWEGLQFVGHHSGVWDDGFDPGWNMAAPVGRGGFPDEWFDGWRPLIARTALTPKDKS